MSEYLLFYGMRYYPSGGWEDFRRRFDSLQEAKTWLETNFPDQYCGWAHIVHNDRIVCSGDGGDYFDKTNTWSWEDINE